ncbi:uncharacterized [Tachysurus ichikawai]
MKDGSVYEGSYKHVTSAACFYCSINGDARRRPGEQEVQEPSTSEPRPPTEVLQGRLTSSYSVVYYFSLCVFSGLFLY